MFFALIFTVRYGLKFLVEKYASYLNNVMNKIFIHYIIPSCFNDYTLLFFKPILLRNHNYASRIA